MTYPGGSIYVYRYKPEEGVDGAVAIKEAWKQFSGRSKASGYKRESQDSSDSKRKSVEFSTSSVIPNVDVSKYVLTPNDSTDPSYTKLTVPYSVICRQRYRDAGAKQKAQFAREIRSHELLQSKALDGVRIHREFCNAILSPAKPEEMIKLSSKQQAKIEQILARED